MLRVVLLSAFLAVAATAVAEEPDPRRPPAIAATNVPVVPDALVERLRQYLSTRAARFRGWAPDGRGLLVQTQFGSTYQLHRVYEPGGRREQLTFGEEPVDGRFQKARTDGSLLLEIAKGGNENFQVWQRPGAFGAMRRLTDGQSRNLLSSVDDGGHRAIVASNRRNGRDMDLFLVSLDDSGNWTELMRVENETWTVHDWSPDGQRLLISQYVSINETRPAVLDLATRQRTPLPALPDGASVAATTRLRFAPDGDAVYLSSDARGEFQQLWRLSLRKGQYDQRPEWRAWRWDVEELDVDRHSGRVAVVLNEDGSSAVWLIDGDRVQPLPLPQGVIDGIEFSPDGRQLGFTLARPNAPVDVFSWNIAGQKLTQWTFSETGGLDPARFVAPELVKFPSFDGLTVSAFYARPPTATAEQKAPVLINIHGGPESQHRPVFSGLDQFWLNERGVAVIAPNVRGSAGYGKQYLTLDNGPKREDSVRDIGALLDWIKQRPELDADRVAVYGGSYGGYMVLASLTNFPDRIKAGVDIVGIANFITFLERTSAYRRDLRRVEYGDERDPAMRAVFERINPTANAHKIRSALLVAHGRNDPRVPFFEAELIAPLVRQNGADVWTIYADNEGHGFGKRENRDYLNAAMVLFLEKHLLGR